METTIIKLEGIVIDEKYLWAIVDKDGHTIIQVLSKTEPTIKKE